MKPDEKVPEPSPAYVRGTLDHAVDNVVLIRLAEWEALVFANEALFRERFVLTSISVIMAVAWSSDQMKISCRVEQPDVMGFITVRRRMDEWFEFLRSLKPAPTNG